MRFLLDANTCIDLMRGNDRVTDRLRGLAPADCAISTVTSFELFTGVAKCSDPDRERAKVALLLRTIVESPFDDAAARTAAEIRGALETTGQTIGPYDLLLAGHAASRGLTLVTSNVGEFSRAPRLAVENWRE